MKFEKVKFNRIKFKRNDLSKSNLKKRNLKKIFVILLSILLLQFAAVEFMLVKSGKSDSQTEKNYLIILGAGINGETLSLSLYERLKTGLQYLEKYPDAVVVVSGGQGRGEAITEAEAMRRFLVDNGIDQSRIMLESKSTSTMENFKYSKKLIEEQSGKPVGEISFITSSFHIFRSKMLARRNGLKACAISAKTPDQIVVQMYIREYLAFFKSLIIDR